MRIAGIKEARLYSYKIDPVTKEVLPIVIHKHNHSIDSLGYALDGFIRGRGGLRIWEKLGRAP